VKRFLVVGDANVDLLFQGLQSPPIFGQEADCLNLRMALGGSAAITASWMAGLGLQLDFWGRVGGDIFGDFAIEELRKCNIGLLPQMQDDAWKTGVCAALASNDDRALVSYLGSIAALKLEHLPLSKINEYCHLHSSSLFIQHGLKPGFLPLFKAAKDAGLTTSLDCGWDTANRWDIDLAALLPYVDYFLPNKSEALSLTSAATVQEAAKRLAVLGNTIVIKCGSEGAYLLGDGQGWLCPPCSIPIVDTTGAGDAFNAGWIYARINLELSFPESLKFANACGALRAKGEIRAPLDKVTDLMNCSPLKPISSPSPNSKRA
jgi:sugar/nucleoside kinase (ribokinase family)